jgi:hypothetical protein
MGKYILCILVKYQLRSFSHELFPTTPASPRLLSSWVLFGSFIQGEKIDPTLIQWIHSSSFVKKFESSKFTPIEFINVMGLKIWNQICCKKYWYVNFNLKVKLKWVEEKLNRFWIVKDCFKLHRPLFCQNQKNLHWSNSMDFVILKPNWFAHIYLPIPNSALQNNPFHQKTLSALFHFSKRPPVFTNSSLFNCPGHQGKECFCFIDRGPFCCSWKNKGFSP